MLYYISTLFWLTKRLVRSIIWSLSKASKQNLVILQKAKDRLLIFFKKLKIIMKSPYGKVKDGLICFDSKILNEGMLEGCIQNEDGDWIELPDHDRIIWKANSKYRFLLKKLEEEVEKEYGTGTKLIEWRTSYEDPETTSIKIKYSELMRGVLPL